MKTTFAEQYVGTENIHKEDEEGEHYQGGEGALSQVIDLLSCSCSSISLFRDDIWCGAVGCVLCDQGEGLPIGLAKTPTSRSTLKASPHYLVLDTNIVLEQIDLLESEGLEHVIVLTTVLEEVRHRSSPIFKRIKDIIANPKLLCLYDDPGRQHCLHQVSQVCH